MWLAWVISCLLGSGNLDLAGNVTGTDYLQFYAAGTTLRLGESQRLYDFGYQKTLQAEIAGPPFDGFHAFITPPFLAFLYLPFSFLPYVLSFIAWSLLGFFFLWASLKILSQNLHPKTVLYTLTWFPIFASISFGQNSLLSLFIFSLVYLSLRKERYFSAGLASSFLLYKPQLLIGLGLLWLVRYKTDRRALLGLLTGGILLAGASLLFLPEASRDYLVVLREVVPSIDTWEGFPHWHSYTLRTFWLLITPNQPVISTTLTLLVSILLVIGFLRFCKAQAGRIELLFAGAVCLTALVAPHNMVYDWTILLVPAVLAWRYWEAKRDLLRGVYISIWIASLISGVLVKAQLAVLPVAVQVAVPVLVAGLYVLGGRLQGEGGEGEGG